LFRRAFSIYDYDPENDVVDILYKVVGKGTRLLSKIQANNILDVLGPIGNGFPLPGKDDRSVLIAGGVGVPPLYLLAKQCCTGGFDPQRLTFLCGLTSESEIPMVARVKTLPISFYLSTDDGSAGFHGFVTSLFEQKLADGDIRDDYVIYTCGPEPMLAVVQQLARKHNKRCYLSLESVMPCGVGTCLGCVVKKAGENKYLRVCREGPVFDSQEVEL